MIVTPSRRPRVDNLADASRMQRTSFTVFRTLDMDGGRGWLDLEDAIDHSQVFSLTSPDGRKQRALRCTPTEIVYECYVLFEKNDESQWRWKGMIMPMKH